MAIIDTRDAQFSEGVIGPTVTARRFRNHDATTGPYDHRAESERLHRWAEATRYHCVHHIDTRVEVRCVHAQHGHSVVPSQSPHDAIEEVRSFRTSIDQDHFQVGTIVGDHEPRHTATRPEVHHHTRHIGQSYDEGASVIDHLRNVAFSQEPQALALVEYVVHVWVE